MNFIKDSQYYKFCGYGFLKNLRFFDPFLILFFLSKGCSYLEIGSLYAIREVTVYLLEIPSGFFADVLGRKRVMVFAFMMYILSFIIFYVFNGFIWFAVAFLFYGMGDAMRTGVHKAMILNYLRNNGWEAEKASYYGATRSWSQRGSAISALLSAALVLYTGNYNSVFLASVVPYFIDMLLILSYPSYLNGEKSLQKGQLTDTIKAHFKELKQAVVNTSSAKVIFNTSVYAGYYKALKDYIQPLLVALALSFSFLPDKSESQRVALFVGIVYSVIYFVAAAASKNAGRIKELFKFEHQGLNILLAIGMLFGAVAGLFHSLYISVGAVITFSVIIIIQNFRRPLGMSFISGCYNGDIMASVFSVESQAESLFAALIALVLGFFADIFGPGESIFIVSLFLMGIAFLLRLKKRAKLYSPFL